MKQKSLVLACCMSILYSPLQAADDSKKALAFAAGAGAVGGAAYGWLTRGGSDKGGQSNIVEDQVARDQIARLTTFVAGDEALEGNSILARLQALEAGGEVIDQQVRRQLNALDLAKLGFDGKDHTLGKVITSMLVRLETLDDKQEGVVQSNRGRIEVLEQAGCITDDVVLKLLDENNAQQLKATEDTVKWSAQQAIKNLNLDLRYVLKAEFRQECTKVFEEISNEAVDDAAQASGSGEIGDLLPEGALLGQGASVSLQELEGKLQDEQAKRTDLETMLAALLKRVEALEKGKEAEEDGAGITCIHMD